MTPLTPVEQVKEAIGSLRAALLETNPLMPNLLQQIYKQLKADPEVVTLLDEVEINTIVEGLKKQTNTEIAAATVKKTTGKKISTMSLSDLGL